jgi:hypothetical protein
VQLQIQKAATLVPMSARDRIADFGKENQPHCLFELL